MRGDSSWNGDVIRSVRALRPGVPRDEAEDAEYEGIIATDFPAGDGLDDAEGEEKPLALLERCLGIPGLSFNVPLRRGAGDGVRADTESGAGARGEETLVVADNPGTPAPLDGSGPGTAPPSTLVPAGSNRSS